MLAMDLRQYLFNLPQHPIDNITNLGELIRLLITNIYIISAFILFFYMVAGGFMVVTSAGNTEKAKNGSQAITNAIIGFVIIFTSFWIIQVIEALTHINILNNPF
jgi:hypothetical protein